MKDYKIVAIKMSSYSYFITKHINSKYHNDYSNQIIDIYKLFDELMGYAQNDIIYLEDTILLKDINSNIINYEEIYLLLDSLIICEKLTKNDIIKCLCY